jgi:hypothetical protein
MTDRLIKKIENEITEEITSCYNILVASFPYDEDHEKNSIDGFGNEESYKDHYLIEATEIYFDDQMKGLE